ncbi:GGDEF domain-containing protein [Luteimonas viscosa]|uniref:diguanylate cyclase n=1 Tax=Luteimonas viscosa TaxID=1132694 RepID=A0A5D4XJN1_9GAMM|nr:GGDEF domain-containing protein [Luteimonas viscosa]TYT24877.1 GGDEF domain-containing protein [Luteimonas viscosa]
MWTRLWTRLKGDFHLAIVVMFGTITVLGITPFAFFRFMVGQRAIGILDMLIVSGIAAGSVYAWRTGRTVGAANFMSVTYSIGCIAVAHLAGLPGVLWVYPVLVANFLLVGRWPALLISTLAVAAITASDAALASNLQKVMFVTTSVVMSLFSFVFASRAELQRSQLEAIAVQDPLTGAINRRGMQAELEIAIASSIRSGIPLGFLIFDLDRFKQVNDSFGHEAGDDVLVQVAELVRRSTRVNDRFFRLGGEEFGLLLPGANTGALWSIAEKLRMAVDGEVQCRGRGITISIGAAPFRPGESATDWLARADAAMYRAKRSGRNCTVIDVRTGDGDPERAASSPGAGFAGD